MKLDAGMLTHDLRTSPEFARKVEAMGYDCLWSSETQHDPYLPVAVAATSTSRIKLGTNIATVFSRSPMITAHIAWDLQKASDGRFILGLGSQVKGHNERRFSVKYESPAAKMREIVLALRAIVDSPSMPGEVDEYGRLGVRPLGQISECGDQGRARRGSICDEVDIVGHVRTAVGVSQNGSDARSIVHGRECRTR